MRADGTHCSHEDDRSKSSSDLDSITSTNPCPRMKRKFLWPWPAVDAETVLSLYDMLRYIDSPRPVVIIEHRLDLDNAWPNKAIFRPGLKSKRYRQGWSKIMLRWGGNLEWGLGEHKFPYVWTAKWGLDPDLPTRTVQQGETSMGYNDMAKRLVKLSAVRWAGIASQYKIKLQISVNGQKQKRKRKIWIFLQIHRTAWIGPSQIPPQSSRLLTKDRWCFSVILFRRSWTARYCPTLAIASSYRMWLR